MANLPKQRVEMPTQDAKVRGGNFNEVATGYTPEMALEEASRCIKCKKPLCVHGCPVEVNIPAFIAEIVAGNPPEAANVIRRTNNLPAVCGRVCPQESQCEFKCILGIKGKPVAIGRLERFVADTEAAAGGLKAPVIPAPSGKRVAVIGAGPSGLTAAADLALMGHKVVIFEALHASGGVLAYGIPEFRLPKEIVRRESEFLEMLGVEFRLNTPVGTAIPGPRLLEEGFDAAFIGTGAGLPNFLGIPGENLKGVYSSNEFLTRVNLMKAYKFPEYGTPVLRGKQVAVVGGGNVAMDSARCALRLGAEKVNIVYRRTRAEMPARLEELEHAVEEGIVIQELVNPVRVVDNGSGWVGGIECVRQELGEPDASGRRKPVAIKGSEMVIPADQFIVAVGQGANPLLTRTWPGLATDRHGHIKVDSHSLATVVPGVFAGGDIVTGAATVILAMGAGKTAARSIDYFLKTGRNPAPPPPPAADKEA